MFTPQNEQGVIILFAQMAQEAGWEFVSIGAAFPDAVLRKDGEEWAVEFEFAASNFLAHKHDHRQCDMIVCWENDYQGCPLPIIEIRNSSSLSIKYSKCDPKDKEIAYWMHRATRAEAENRKLSQEIKGFRVETNEEEVLQAWNMKQNRMTIPQIAEVQGCSERTVNNRLKQAKAQMNGHSKAEAHT